MLQLIQEIILSSFKTDHCGFLDCSIDFKLSISIIFSNNSLINIFNLFYDSTLCQSLHYSSPVSDLNNFSRPSAN